jgi:hypothetical protein
MVKHTVSNRKEAVIDYITKHDDCIREQLDDYMRGYTREGKELKEKSPYHASIKKTRAILKELMTPEAPGKDPIVSYSQDPRNRRAHHLHIGSKFGIVYRHLENIEQLIIIWDNPIRRINSDYRKFPPGSPDIIPGYYVKEKFAVVYIKAIRAMLYELLDQLAILKLSEENAQIIFKRVMRLIEKLIEQTTDKPSPKDILIDCMKESLSVKEALADNALASHYFKPKMYDSLIQSIEEFDKFLS